MTPYQETSLSVPCLTHTPSYILISRVKAEPLFPHSLLILISFFYLTRMYYYLFNIFVEQGWLEVCAQLQVRKQLLWKAQLTFPDGSLKRSTWCLQNHSCLFGGHAMSVPHSRPLTDQHTLSCFPLSFLHRKTRSFTRLMVPSLQMCDLITLKC